MRKKILGIVVCILLSTPAIPVAALIDNHEIRLTSYEVNVPIWKKGDEWTYHFTESRTYNYNYIFSGDLTYKVIDDSGDSYVLEAITKFKGTIDLGGFGVKTTRFSSISMRIQMRQDDLGLESFIENIKGIFLLKIGSITLPIPIQIKGKYTIGFDPAWAIIPFPLYDGKYGNLSGTEILHNVYMDMFWGFVSVLPSQNYSIPLTPVPYTCSEEQITVEAGTFDVYNVSAEMVDGSQFVSYYSEEVGNVAKEVIYIPYGGDTVWYTLTLELKDWSYSP